MLDQLVSCNSMCDNMTICDIMQCINVYVVVIVVIALVTCFVT